MTTSVTINGTVTLDESSGLQNMLSIPPGDADDNDVSLTDLMNDATASVFYDRLFVDLGLDPTFPTDVGVAASAEDFMQVTSDGKLSDVELSVTDATASGLFTLDGNQIFLYNDPDNPNIIFGREGSDATTADATGDIVFALFLDITSTGDNTADGQMWMVQFEPLHHPDPTDDDGALVNLAGHLNITVNEELVFGFDKLPAGQNLFGTVAEDTSSPGIIVVAGNPVIDGDGNYTNTSETVNTSKAGGDVSIANTTQNTEPGESFYFTYVKDIPEASLAGGGGTLTQTDADNAGYIEYGSLYQADSAFVLMAQVNGPDLAGITIEASYLTGDPQQADFLAALGTGTHVDITGVRVIDTNTGMVIEDWSLYGSNPIQHSDVVIVIDPITGIASVTGLSKGHRVEFDTDGDHNQAFITGTSGKFDLGAFGLLDVATTPDTFGFEVGFEDDGPTIGTQGTEPDLVVDETDLTTDATANFAGNFNVMYGTDGQAASDPLTYELSIPADGTDSGLVDTATGEAVWLYKEGDDIVGRTSGTNDVVFVVSVDGLGNVTLDQQRAVVHPITTMPNETVTLSSDDLVVLTATATDGDGDSASASLNIGENLIFHDDSPSVTATDTGIDLTVDETNLPIDASADFSGEFSKLYGEDGEADSDPLIYELSITGGNGTDSGLVDTETGQAVLLSNNGGVIEGRTEISDELVFTVSVDSDGNVTLDQKRAVIHSDPTMPDETVTLASDDLVVLTATVTDGDGDSDDASLNIGQNLVFHDDAPSIGATDGGINLIVDETVLGTDDMADFSGEFTPDYGADGEADSDPLTYDLSIPLDGTNSGLVDTATGQAVLLSDNGGVIEGRTETSDELVFTVSVDSDGNVILDQKRAVIHSDPTMPNETVTLSSDDLVVLTATATDGDGDSDDAPLNIGQNLIFHDDAPSIVTQGVEPELEVDETTLGDDDTADFSDNFVPTYGADGEAGSDPLIYELSITGGDGTDSGLVDTASGEAVLLYKEGDNIVGRTSGTNDVVFTVSVDSEGIVALDQQRAIIHPITGNPDDTVTLASDDLVVLTATATDGDGDSDDASLNIGHNLTFRDDGPDMTVTDNNINLTVDESDLGTDATADFSGEFTPEFGADGPLNDVTDPEQSYTLSFGAGSTGLYDTATGLEVQLRDNAGVIEGYVDDGGTEYVVFTVSVDDDGVVELDQIRAVIHGDTENHDEATNPIADNLIVLTSTAIDGDSDNDSNFLNIGQNLIFKDDGPSVTLDDKGIDLTVDESDFATDATADFSGEFITDYGADGAAASDELTYMLSIGAGDTGLFDTATGLEVQLRVDGGVVEGYVNDGTDHVVFTVTVDDSGNVELDQKRAVIHDNTADHDDPTNPIADDLVVLTATATDGDGDSDEASLTIGQNLIFKDDGLTAGLMETGAGVVHDETDGVDGGTDDQALPAPTVFTDLGAVLGWAQSGGAVVEDDSQYGADGEGSHSFDLAIPMEGTDSGLDALDGNNILLYKEGDLVVGRVDDGANTLAFAISIDGGTGVLSTAQYVPIKHPDNPLNHDEQVNLLDGALQAEVTATDGDGDSDTDSLNIGDLVGFKDDGPSATLEKVGQVLHDETEGVDALSDDQSDPVPVEFAEYGTALGWAQSDGAVVSVTAGFGTDGDGGSDLMLTLTADGIDSGVDALDGTDILLYQDGDLVLGRVGAADGDVAFAIMIDGSGVLSVAQYVPLLHPDGSDPDDVVSLTTDALQVEVMLTDGDDDTDVDSVDIGDLVSFRDDHPTTDHEGILDTVEEDDLPGGNNEDMSSGEHISLEVDLSLLIDSGRDAPADFDLIEPVSGPVLYSQGDQLSYSVSGDTLTASAGGRTIFTWQVTEAGLATLTLMDQFDHAPGDGENFLILNLTGFLEIRDADDDLLALPAGFAQYQVQDDVPTIGPIDNGLVDYVVGSSVSNSLNESVGTDEDTSADGGETTIVSYTDHATLSEHLSDDGKVLTYYDDDIGTMAGVLETGEEVFRLSVDTLSNKGEYLFEVLADAPSIPLDFDFDALPSGQNLFGTLSEDPSMPEVDQTGIIIIGADPDLAEDGTYTNISDTINSSKGGGPVSIANGNQSTNPGEGIYFAYVNNIQPSYLSGAPGGLDQNEADDADNILYDGGTFEADSAYVDIAQVVGKDLASIELSAYDMDGAPQQRDFVDYIDDTFGPKTDDQVTIDAIIVTDSGGNVIVDTTNGIVDPDGVVTVAFNHDGNGSVLVTGLDQDYRVQFFTDGHDLALIEGVEGKFDIGGFAIVREGSTPDELLDFTVRIEDFDGDTADSSFSVGIDGTGEFDDDMVVGV